MPKSERYVVGLDIGTTKIGCVVAESRESGAVDVVGVGESPSRGPSVSTVYGGVSGGCKTPDYGCMSPVVVLRWWFRC